MKKGYILDKAEALILSVEKCLLQHPKTCECSRTAKGVVWKARAQAFHDAAEMAYDWAAACHGDRVRTRHKSCCPENRKALIIARDLESRAKLEGKRHV